MPTKARIPLPSVLDPTTTKCVQFNIPDDPEWMGMFWGALDQLSVWTAYDRSGDTSAADVASVWKQVIRDARDGSCEFPQPNWYLDIADGSTGHIDGLAWSQPQMGITDGVPYLRYDLVMWGIGEAGADITVVGRSVETGDLVGGTFLDIEVRNEFDPAGKAFVATTLDCLSNTSVYTEFTPWPLAIGDYRQIQFTCGHPSVYWAVMVISGDYLCSVS
jgi:hypothetical protein